MSGAERSDDGTDDAPATGSGGSRSRDGLLSTWPRRVAVGVVALLVVLAVLYLTGVIGAPSAGIADRGDWGTVTDERTEIVTTVWVNNPNPVGVALGETLGAEYSVYMNGVRVAEGAKTDVTVPGGNTTTDLRTDLLNDQLPAWWVAFVRAGETVELDVNATLTVDAVATVERDVHVDRTILEDDRPVVGALSAAANDTSGTYTRSVDASQVDGSDLGDVDVIGDESVTVGYEVERGWASWESVTEDRTTALIHLRVHNPGDVPVPAAPDGVGVAIDTNDVRLFAAETDEFTLENVGADAVIGPGETREVTFAVTMDNDRIDEWFTSHVRESAGPGEEATAVSAQFQVVFEDPLTGTTFRLPANSPATYDCEFRTAILVDDQETSTTCGEGASPARDDSTGDVTGTTTPAGTTESTGTDRLSGTVVGTTAPDGTALPGTDGGALATTVEDEVGTVLAGTATATVSVEVEPVV
jgi:LEA14-like dessication related protein